VLLEKVNDQNDLNQLLERAYMLFDNYEVESEGEDDPFEN